MIFTCYPYKLQFKYPFKIAHGTRTHTPVVFVKLEHERYTAWGEATLPPYLPETQQTVIDFVNAFAKSASGSLDELINQLHDFAANNYCAKAAVDMALWHLKSQMVGKPIGELLDIESKNYPLATYTIGVSALDEMKTKIAQADVAGFEIFKLKLDGETDEAAVNNFKQLSGKPFMVDVNQGWENAGHALHKIEWLAKTGCLAVEQPLVKDRLFEMKEIKKHAALPVYADESCQTINELEPVADSFNGINVKLMKCGGVTPAVEMIQKAKAMDLEILIGCMSESSVGCTAAAQLTPLAGYADLDGPYLIANDPFSGMKVENGRVAIHKLKGPSIGL